VDDDSSRENRAKEVDVTPRTTPTIVGRGMQMGRRTQFPVRYYLASTIHRVQGDNVSLLATELSLHKKEYRLWQREQFAVLISRVHNCKDLIFVGNVVDTRASIEHIMSHSSKWDSLIEHYLSNLNVSNQAGHASRAVQLTLDFHPFLPMYRELPSSACGYAYMLTSLSCVAPSYIGECVDLRSEIRLHNTGYGADLTRNSVLHPWGVYAFVYGFNLSDDNGQAARTSFADTWRFRSTGVCNPDEVFVTCSVIANEWANGKSNAGFVHLLTVVKCGQSSLSTVVD
jgi:hypothetical protein